MSRRNPLPASLRGRPYAAAVAVGGTAGALGLAAYAVGTRLLVPDHMPLWVVGVDLVVASCALTVGGVTALGRLTSTRALGVSSAMLVAGVLTAVFTEMVGDPQRVGPLSAHLFAVLLASAVLIRTRLVLAGLMAASAVAWVTTVRFVEGPHFDRSDWLPSWAATVLLTFVVHTIVRTEQAEENAMRQAVQSESWRDPLTGLANRIGFTRQAGLLVASADRLGLPVWAGFVDVDHFKSVNDRLGHASGDLVLVGVANALEEIGRLADLPARWGGDEFVLLGMGVAPDPTDLERRIVAHLTTALDPSIQHLWRPQVTVGVAGAPLARAEEAVSLLASADRQMYERRRARRLAPSDGG